MLFCLNTSSPFLNNWSQKWKKYIHRKLPQNLPTRLTGTLSGYFFRIFSPSARLFSKGCSSLYSHFIDTLLQVQNTSLAVIKPERTLAVFPKLASKMALNVCLPGNHVMLCSQFSRWRRHTSFIFRHSAKTNRKLLSFTQHCNHISTFELSRFASEKDHDEN